MISMPQGCLKVALAALLVSPPATATPIQPHCEAILKRTFEVRGESFTVQRWSEHRINGNTATRSVTWMTHDRDDTPFRADCVWIDGDRLPSIWLLNTAVGEPRKLNLVIPEKQEPEPEEVVEQEQPAETVGWWPFGRE